MEVAEYLYGAIEWDLSEMDGDIFSESINMAHNTVAQMKDKKRKETTYVVGFRRDMALYPDVDTCFKHLTRKTKEAGFRMLFKTLESVLELGADPIKVGVIGNVYKGNDFHHSFLIYLRKVLTEKDL